MCELGGRYSASSVGDVAPLPHPCIRHYTAELATDNRLIGFVRRTHPAPTLSSAPPPPPLPAPSKRVWPRSKRATSALFVAGKRLSQKAAEAYVGSRTAVASDTQLARRGCHTGRQLDGDRTNYGGVWASTARTRCHTSHYEQKLRKSQASRSISLRDNAKKEKRIMDKSIIIFDLVVWTLDSVATGTRKSSRQALAISTGVGTTNYLTPHIYFSLLSCR